MSPTYRRSATLLEAELGDELVALDAEAGTCFGFNAVATDVWRQLESPRSFDELMRALAESYDVGEDQCRSELRELLDSMAEKGLVAADDPSAC